VSFALRDHGLRTIVLDIEGTTTPIVFVHDVLFPYARTHLRDYLRTAPQDKALQDVLDQLRRDHSGEIARGEQPPEWSESSVERVALFVEWLMDRDRKVPGLKLLQGRIWDHGFQSGTLRGEVYPDVPPALRRWQHAGIDVAIYSSGSEHAQRLVFRTTPFGDLTSFVSRFFDTGVGPKVSSDSYRRIARELACPPAEMLFVSDVTAELTAAREAGVHVLLSVRPGNLPQPDAGHVAVRNFDEILT
jgi:enolase-phosphatase E1